MEALFKVSRSIINNSVYEKVDQARFHNHQQAIRRYKSIDSLHTKDSSQQYLQNLHKYKAASQNVNQLFDSRLIENKSLYRRLVDVENKK